MLKVNKIHYLCEGMIEKNVPITFCYHLTSLEMPNGDPLDGFFYTILALMIDSYVIPQMRKSSKIKLVHVRDETIFTPVYCRSLIILKLLNIHIYSFE